jgi:hypothetical protein
MIRLRTYLCHVTGGEARPGIEQLYLQQKTWPMNVWRERYLDHPLMGTLARRLSGALSKRDTPVSVSGTPGRSFSTMVSACPIWVRRRG